MDLGVNGGLSVKRMRTQGCRRRKHWLVFLGLGESELVLGLHRTCLLAVCGYDAAASDRMEMSRQGCE